MPEKLVIGDIAVNRNEKKFGFLKVGETPSSDVNIPIGIINGSGDGPILCVIAGIHGTEYAGIGAAIKIFNETEAKQLRGGLLIVPVVNMLGFQKKSRETPIDNIDLNRIFPGRKDGSISHLLAYSLFNTVIMKANYLISLHGGDYREKVLHFVTAFETENAKVFSASKALAQNFGVKYISIRSKKEIKEKAATAEVLEATRRDIPSIITEIGAWEYDENDMLIQFNGIINVMRYLKMIEGKVHKVPTKIMKDTLIIRVKSGGIFYPKVDLGDSISKGQVLGVVKNLRGKIVEEVKAPSNGLLRISFGRCAVNSGDEVLAAWPMP